MCLGLIQAYLPSSSLTQLADVVLGVPFMRSVYTVMAYDPPDSHGAFPNASAQLTAQIRPRLGLLGLIDPTAALDEFHQERVLNQALPPTANQAGNGSNSGGSGSGTGSRTNVESGKKLSLGVEVLIGIVGFLGLLCAIFGAWYLVQRRRRNRERRGLYVGADSGSGSNDEKDREAVMQREAAFILARRSTISSRYGPAEDTVRAKKFEEYMRRRESDVVSEHERIVSGYSDTPGHDRTLSYYKDNEDASRRYSEMGYRTTYVDGDDATLVNSRNHHGEGAQLIPLDDLTLSPKHARMPTLEGDAAVAVPLLAHMRSDSQASVPAERSPLGMGRPASRARVGSVASDMSSSAAARMSATRSVSGPRPMSGSRRSSAMSASSGSVRRSSGVLSGQPPSSPSPPLPPLPSLPPDEPNVPSGAGSTEDTVGHGSSLS
jgi:hypothetical protein